MEQKLKNEFNLSEELKDALEYNSYDLIDPPPNVYTVTQVTDSPRAKILAYRHRHEYTRDVLDSFHAVFGSAAHGFMERAAKRCPGKYLTEQRWFMDVKTKEIRVCNDFNPEKPPAWYDEGIIYLSGKYDSYNKETKTLVDYKTTGGYSLKMEPQGKIPHRSQIKIHAFALDLLGLTVEKGKLIYLIKDYYSNDFVTTRNPYSLPEYEVNVPLSSPEKAHEYILERIKLYQECEALPDERLPLCTEYDRWINKKTGENNRCLGKKQFTYCYGSAWCTHYQSLVS